MTEKKTPLDLAFDLFVYAPLGLALTARDELPKLIEKGRQQVTGQVTTAKIIGEFAVKEGQKEGSKRVQQVTKLFAGRTPRPAAAPSSPAPPAAPSVPKPSAPAPAAQRPEPTPVVAEPTPAVVEPAELRAEPVASTPGNGARPTADLAIPGYDTLSASHVVSRLAGLEPQELAAVAEYESSTRHRKTILNRIAQLQTGPAPS